MQVIRGTILCAALVAVFATGPSSTAEAGVRCGRASWYSMPGKRTASGERMNPRAMTAAHRSYRFGSRVRVKNMRTGRSVTVRINDRGPYARGRIIDLSKVAAARLGIINTGTGRVCISLG